MIRLKSGACRIADRTHRKRVVRAAVSEQADPMDRALHPRWHHRQRHAHGHGEVQAALGQRRRETPAPIRSSPTCVQGAPDGYTFLTVIAAHAANATLYAGKLPFDAVKSFAPVSLAAIAPLIMTANNNFPARDVKELIAYAKANPGKISFGSSGIGAAAHLTTELFKQTAGVDMVHIPYKGTAGALQDEMGGNIQILVDVPSTLMPHVRGGKIKALAMFSGKRIAGAPEVPTMAEAGGPALEASTWILFLAPAGTPQEIVNRMSAEAAKAIAAGDIKGRFEAIGIEPVGSTPQQAGKFLDDEIAKWSKVITAAGVKAER
jgi:tripartite-type tricarboxylate transporter receptor subunit TctC